MKLDNALWVVFFVTGAILLTLAFAYGQALPQPANPPLMTALWSNLNPDIVAIMSKDQGVGATALTILPNHPNSMSLTISSPQTGPVFLDFDASGDNISVAHQLCATINGNNVLHLGNIACQDTSPVLGITNWSNNLATVTPRTGGFLIQQGSSAFDAGPIMALERIPDGVVPTAGANVGQITFAGANSTCPGQGCTQYVTISGTVVDPNVGNINGAFAIYTARTFPGPFPGLDQRVNVWRGVSICDLGSVCPVDLGPGTLHVPQQHSDGQGPGLFIGGRKICVAPPGSFAGGKGLDGYLYLAEGSACPGQ